MQPKKAAGSDLYWSNGVEFNALCRVIALPLWPIDFYIRIALFVQQ